MPQLLRESEFKDLFTEDLPMIDARAPLEFERGAFPNATNLPLLLDTERHEIGKRFKNAGKEAAINSAMNWSAARASRSALAIGRNSCKRTLLLSCIASGADCALKLFSNG